MAELIFALENFCLALVNLKDDFSLEISRVEEYNQPLFHQI